MDEVYGFIGILMLLDVRNCTYVVFDTRYCFIYLKCIFTLALLILVAEMLVWKMVWVLCENSKLLIIFDHVCDDLLEEENLYHV